MGDLKPQGDWFAAVYGLEELSLKRLTVLEGELDFEKLKTGKYILEGIVLQDDSTPIWETSHFDIGDKVTLHSYKRGQVRLIDDGGTLLHGGVRCAGAPVRDCVVCCDCKNCCRKSPVFSYWFTLLPLLLTIPVLLVIGLLLPVL